MVRQTVGILIFDDVEVLDFAGPFEVFSRTRLVPGADSRRTDESAPFDVFTVGRNHIVNAIGGLKVIPHHSLADPPPIDILVVPGGFGTGALLLAEVGALRGRRATTHWAALDLLASIDSTILVQRDARVVWDTVVTSAGVSAGIDMAFSVVEKLHGPEVARETAHYIEYVPQHQNAF